MSKKKKPSDMEYMCVKNFWVFKIKNQMLCTYLNYG